MYVMWLVLSGLTDSPVPEWDSFITSLSIIATWMLARKIYEHWYSMDCCKFCIGCSVFIQGDFIRQLFFILFME